MSQSPTFLAEKESHNDAFSVENTPSRKGGVLDSGDSIKQSDDQLERTVWKKLDLWVLPVVTIYYLLSFLVSC